MSGTRVAIYYDPDAASFKWSWAVFATGTPSPSADQFYSDGALAYGNTSTKWGARRAARRQARRFGDEPVPVRMRVRVEEFSA